MYVLMKVKLMKTLFIAVFCFTMPFCAICASHSLEKGVDEINAGNLTSALQSFESVIRSSDAPAYEKAIAHKNVGTIQFRMGENAIPSYDKAETLFLESLKIDSTAELKAEYGKMLYQRINARLCECERELSYARFEKNLNAFDFLKKYIFPARKDQGKVKEYYPSSAQADLLLQEGELSLAEARIWKIAAQNDSSKRAYDKAEMLMDQTLALQNIQSDAKKKAQMQKIVILLEHETISQAKLLDKIVPLCKVMVKEKSGNIELDNAAVILYARCVLALSQKPDELFPDMEEKQMQSVKEIEMLREKNIGQDFEMSKRYFASRTGAYETFLEYCSQKQNIKKMLEAIDSIKNRSIQDFIQQKAKDNDLLNRIQSKLKEQNSSMLVYFIGQEKTWVIYIDADETSFRTVSGSSEICSKIDFVVKSCENEVGFGKIPRRSKVKMLEELNWLYLNLFKPEYEKCLSKKNSMIYISPHNRLNYFPFCALVDQLDSSSSWSEKVSNSHFLAESGIPLAFIPSLQIYAESPISPEKEQGDTFIFARNDFSNPSNSMRIDLTGQLFTFRNLPGVKTEVETIAEKLKISASHLFFNNRATEDNIQDVFQKKKVGAIHIATHGALHPYHSLDSFLLMSATSANDGELTVRELLTKYRNKFQCNLIVLSACNTNRGEKNLLPGDDIAALSLAFMISGAKNVISTQWPAWDETFPVIMCSFYSQNDYQNNPAKCMSHALQLFLKDTPQRRDPFYWANIIIQTRR